MSQNCINKYKSDFTAKFLEIMDKNAYKWKEIQKDKCRSLYSIKSILIYLCFSLIFCLPIIIKPKQDSIFFICLSVLCFICLVITNIINTNKEYQNTVKSRFFPTLVKIFGKDVHYISKYTSYMKEALADNSVDEEDTSNIRTDLGQNLGKVVQYRICNNIIDDSMLYPHKITKRKDEDRLYGKYNDTEFIINETDFGWEVEGRQQPKSYNRMFKGIVMYFKLNKTVKNTVIITSKNMFNKIPKGFEKVEVEYNKFTKKYNVYVENINTSDKNGQIEARYFLNTALLERFMQIQTSFKVSKMCCSIYNDTMLIMLSTRKDLFEMNHLFGKIDDVNQYKHLFNEFASVLSFIDVLNLSSKTKL